MHHGIKQRQRSSFVILLAAGLSVACSSEPSGGDGDGTQPFGSSSPSTSPSDGATSPVSSSPTPGQPDGSGTGPGTAPSGTVPGPATNPGDPNTSGPTTAPTTVTQNDGSVLDCNTVRRPPTPLRRLTRFEYDNTVRDLLGTALTPSSAFPPDEVADGFSNNALVLTVSGLHAEKYLEAAEALAAEAAGKLPTLLPCDPGLIGEEACAREFASRFGRRAFRRALDTEDLAVLMEAYAAGAANGFQKGVEVMIRAVLQSPHFLYRVEFTGASQLGAGMVRLNGFETATRLAYLLWSSAPDDALLEAAETGQLATAEQVEARARVMLQDPRAKAAAAEFFRQWLGLTRLETTSKHAETFPSWSEDMRRAMRDEAAAFVGHVLWSDTPTLESLFTVPLGMPAGPLAALYGVQPSAAGQIVPLPAQERVGILTLPAFLAAQAHPDQTSPVLRGKFIRGKVLCTPPPPPPPDADVTPPPPGEGGTARERYSRHSTDRECATCHQLMDPLGFPFENYDALGAYRTSDNGQPVDVSGEMIASLDMDGPFQGVAGLAAKLSGSDQVRDCIATQWFKYAVGRSEEGGDACSLLPLQNGFELADANLLELMVGTTRSEVFLYRRAEEVAQ